MHISFNMIFGFSVGISFAHYMKHETFLINLICTIFIELYTSVYLGYIQVTKTVKLCYWMKQMKIRSNETLSQ